MSAPVTDAQLQRALSSDKDLSAASLATKILVSRLRREVKDNPGTMGTKVAELRAFFDKNAFAVNDLAVL